MDVFGIQMNYLSVVCLFFWSKIGIQPNCYLIVYYVPKQLNYISILYQILKLKLNHKHNLRLKKKHT